MTAVEVTSGDGPIILGMPHTGTFVPDDIWATLNERGRTLADTDWHIDRLYDGLLPGATTVRATFHRYVIDANRDPSGASLYPGQNTTGLCPTTDFDGLSIYRHGSEPRSHEIESRRLEFHAPYHAALATEIERVRSRHGVAVLYDCHSIRSQIPFLFDGVLPDFNIGTNGGVACDPEIEGNITCICAGIEGHVSVLNGRFKGGWTTRHYGNPAGGVHAVQMELAQATHLESESPPFTYSEAKAARLRPHLCTILQGLQDWALYAAETRGS
jgi:N-formylglutamate deformylase